MLLYLYAIVIRMIKKSLLLFAVLVVLFSFAGSAVAPSDETGVAGPSFLTESKIGMHNVNFMPFSYTFVIGAELYPGGGLTWGDTATIHICNDGCSVIGSCCYYGACAWGCPSCFAHHGRHQHVYLGGTAAGPVTWEIVCHGIFPRDEFEILFNPGTPADPTEFLVFSVRDGVTICRDRLVTIEVTRSGITTTVVMHMRACCLPCLSSCLSCDGCFNCIKPVCCCGTTGFCPDCCVLFGNCHNAIFDLNDGDSEKITARAGNNDVLRSAVPTPTLAGFTFNGWRYVGQTAGTPNLTNADIEAKIFTQSVTFIAQWMPVGGNGGGGGNGTGNATITDNSTVTGGSTVPDGSTVSGGATLVDPPVHSEPNEPEIPVYAAPVIITSLFMIGFAAFAYRRVEEAKEK